MTGIKTNRGLENCRIQTWLSLFFVFVSLFCSLPTAAEEMDLTGMSIEELMDITITSVSKKSQLLSESAAAVFVITNDDLRRSGATNIPDALRMVPGINVARIDSSKWAVSSRGSNSRFFDKLLVMIDGRSVYTPTFSGAYWEVQDMMLEDVERIEVIRGPGATLWGANAVNGVINIITQSAEKTQGGLVSLGGGTYEKAFAAARYGAAIGENSHGRFYFKGFKRGEYVYLDDSGAGDDWGSYQGGFRLDTGWSASDSLTVQGDIYRGNIDQTLAIPTVNEPYATVVADSANVAGGNLLARWHRIFSSTSELTVQSYYDRTEREEAFVGQFRDSFDFDLHHHLSAFNRHDLNWGVRYRKTSDEFNNTDTITINPSQRKDNLFSAFVQDEITLAQERLWLTVGTKVEHNDYTGVEIQPNARLFWSINNDHKIWSSVSRSVRTPSRVETDGRIVNVVYPPTSDIPIPVVPVVYGSDDFESEVQIAYELGYRFIPNQAFSIDLAAFYNDYDDLRTSAQGDPEFMGTYVQAPVYFINEYATHTYGLELAAAWQTFDWLKLDFAYTYLESDMEENFQAGKAPKHQVSLRSFAKLRQNLDLDIWLRFVDEATAMFPRSPQELFYQIDDYFTLDMRLAWQPLPGLELALVGQNLLESSHTEFVQEAYSPPTEVPRSVYGKITWCF